MLMRHKDTTVDVLGGMVRVQMPDGEMGLLRFEDLEVIEHLEDRGRREGDPYVTVVLEKENKSFSVEANGVWPEDIVPFILDALKVMVREGQKKGS